MNKLIYFNDTGRVVRVHPGTHHYCTVEDSPINPLEERVFKIPDGKTPWIKMWDFGETWGLSIFIATQEGTDDDEMGR